MRMRNKEDEYCTLFRPVDSSVSSCSSEVCFPHMIHQFVKDQGLSISCSPTTFFSPKSFVLHFCAPRSRHHVVFLHCFFLSLFCACGDFFTALSGPLLSPFCYFIFLSSAPCFRDGGEISFTSPVLFFTDVPLSLWSFPVIVCLSSLAVVLPLFCQ